MMHFHIYIYIKVMTQQFLGKHSFHKQFPKVCLTQKQHDYFFKIPLKKLLTSTVHSKFTSTGHCIQPIKLLVPSPSTLEPRNTSIKPINNKPKALKLSLIIPRQVPLPKRESTKHTRNSQDYNTTKAFNFPSANNVHTNLLQSMSLPIHGKISYSKTFVKESTY